MVVPDAARCDGDISRDSGGQREGKGNGELQENQDWGRCESLGHNAPESDGDCCRLPSYHSRDQGNPGRPSEKKSDDRAGGELVQLEVHAGIGIFAEARPDLAEAAIHMRPGQRRGQPDQELPPIGLDPPGQFDVLDDGIAHRRMASRTFVSNTTDEEKPTRGDRFRAPRVVDAVEWVKLTEKLQERRSDRALPEGPTLDTRKERDEVGSGSLALNDGRTQSLRVKAHVSIDEPDPACGRSRDPLMNCPCLADPTTGSRDPPDEWKRDALFIS